MIQKDYKKNIKSEKTNDNIFEKRNGVLYIRVSTDDQVEYSPDSQIKLGYKYAKEHNIEIQSIYRDDGISGKNAYKRTDFQRMIADAKKKPKPFDVILVYSFSRFARNREDSIVYKSLLRKKLGIDVISITQPLSEGKESIILEAIYEAMDEYYSIDLAENSLRGKVEKASRGEHQGNAPYGYKYNKNTKMIEIDEEKAKIVKIIFEEWIKPGSTIRSVCRMLNDSGVLTTRGKKWLDRSMYLILQNPVYIGYSRFTVGGMKRNYDNPDTIIVKGNHEAIISNEIWDLAQQKMKQHKETWFKYKKEYTKHEFWLRGIVKCSNCGSSLVHCNVRTKPRPYFQCTGFVKGKCTESHYIREDQLLPAILEQIKKDFTDKLEIKISDSLNNENTNQIKLLNSQLNNLAKKRERIKEAFINEIDTLEEYRENKKRIDQEKKKIENELEKLNDKKQKEKQKQKIYKFSKTAYDLLSDKTVDEKIKDDVAHKLFEKIVYDKNNNTLEITYK